MLQRERNGLTAAGPPLSPPKDWFEMPEPDEPTGWTVTADGQVYGHAALWGSCHTGKQGRCVTPPKNGSGYRFYRTGMVETEDGDAVPTGRITLGTGHASLTASPTAAAEHYDNTGTVVADVVAQDGKYGIWVTGALRPNVTPERIRELRGASLSGDWRNIGGKLEMLGLLAVNVPGFPVPRAAASLAASAFGEEEQVMALVGAGIADMDELDELEEISDEDFDAELGQLAAAADHAESDRSKKIEKVMEEFRKGKLKSHNGKKVTSRKQALAIALSEARALSAAVEEDCGCLDLPAARTLPTDNALYLAQEVVQVTAASWDESKHPRYRKGDKRGGEFSPKGEASASSSAVNSNPQVHTFSSTSEAYNASQTHDSIRDGDVVSVPSEKIVGVMVGAWPVAVGERTGQFHSMSDSVDWAAVPMEVTKYPGETPTKDYSASFAAAVDELNRVLFEAQDDNPNRRGMKASVDPLDLPAARRTTAGDHLLATSFTQQQRAKLAEQGQAMPDGSLPIRNRADLGAVLASGRVSGPAEREFVARRARELGAVGMLPAAWEETLVAAPFDESKHPRYRKGDPRGGEFAPKTSMSEDDPGGWETQRVQDALKAGDRPALMAKELRARGYKVDIRGPKAGDRSAEAAAARESAAKNRARAAELRAQGNEEHARDYDEAAARADARAAELGGKSDTSERSYVDKRTIELVQYYRKHGDWPSDMRMTESGDEYVARNRAYRIVKNPSHPEAKLDIARLKLKRKPGSSYVSESMPIGWPRKVRPGTDR